MSSNEPAANTHASVDTNAPAHTEVPLTETIRMTHHVREEKRKAREEKRKARLKREGLDICDYMPDKECPEHYVLVTIDLYPYEVNLNDFGAVVGALHAELQSRDQEQDYANPDNEAPPDGIRFRIWEHSRRKRAWQVYADIMEDMYEYVMVQDMNKTLFAVPLEPGNEVDVVISYGNGLMYVDLTRKRFVR